MFFSIFAEKFAADGRITESFTLSQNTLSYWLNYDPDKNLLFGEPDKSQITYFYKTKCYYDLIRLTFTAQDSSKATQSTRFFLSVQNCIPQQMGASLQSQLKAKSPSWIIEKTFKFAISRNTFIDVDNDTLTYQLLQSDGKALPQWLQFDEQLLIIFGKAPEALLNEEFSFKLICSDGIQSIEDQFQVTIKISFEYIMKYVSTAATIFFALIALYAKWGWFYMLFCKGKYRFWRPQLVMVDEPYEKVIPLVKKQLIKNRALWQDLRSMVCAQK